MKLVPRSTGHVETITDFTGAHAGWLMVLLTLNTTVSTELLGEAIHYIAIAKFFNHRWQERWKLQSFALKFLDNRPM